jgi:hypothetical protein
VGEDILIHSRVREEERKRWKDGKHGAQKERREEKYRNERWSWNKI